MGCRALGMIGRHLGHYRIERKLGEGGVGAVYRAVDERLGRPVALKVLLADLLSRPDVVERFRAEARTLARLHHPNIALLYGFEEVGGSLVMAMELVEGMTLATLVRNAGRLSLEHALSIFVQALDGIGHAHSLGIVHRDIKGSNLMLDTQGTLKVMDFGIARIVGSQRHTLLGHVVGTPEYMAPEQIRGEEIDCRADVYSLGTLLYLLLAARTPFQGGSGFDVMRAQVEEEPPPLRRFAPDVPEAVEVLLTRALHKDPEARIGSCAELHEALEPFLPASERKTPAPTPLDLVARTDLAPAGDGPTRVDEEGDAEPADAACEMDPTRVPPDGGMDDGADEAESSEAPTREHGRPPRPRWRRPAAGVGVVAAVLLVNAVWWARPGPARDAPGVDSPAIAAAASERSAAEAAQTAGAGAPIDDVAPRADRDEVGGDEGSAEDGERREAAAASAETSDAATPAPAASPGTARPDPAPARRASTTEDAPVRADARPPRRRVAPPSPKRTRERTRTEPREETAEGWIIRRD